MKKKIDLWEFAGTILEKIGKGALLTTAADGKINTMVIGWGTLGIEWGKPLCTVFVRESRFTKELLDKNPEFTVNIPLEELDKEILKLCGSRSGRDVDKLAQLGLTTEAPEVISVPGIREVPVTLECRVVHSQQQTLDTLAEDARARYYPETPEFPQADRHTAYSAQVVAAYIIQE